MSTPIPIAPEDDPGLDAFGEAGIFLEPNRDGIESRIPSAAYVDVRDSAEFGELRRRFRRFAFPMTALFLAWYFAYVLLSVYAKEFMSTPFLGRYFNVGHFLGLLQFASTFLITWLYIRHANTKLDPMALGLRSRLEEDAK